MDLKLFFTIASEVVGGLGVFLLGMKNMSEGLQAVSGDRLRKIISHATSNRIFGVLVGLLVTCIIQSSSVTTVMVVGFVNSGIMTLMQAIGVIFGANIGTTITGWILVLDVGKHGLPMLGIAAFAFLFSRKDRVRYIGMTVMGIGMVFFGLELMKNGFKPLRTHPEFNAWFHAFQATSYPGIIKCASVGCLLTMIVQSSSATLGITIGLASTGVIDYRTAAALVLGENIGTTITAWLASLGANANAKRAAYAHIFFNVFGCSWFIAAFPFAIHAVARMVALKTGLDPLQIRIEDMDEKVFGTVITAGIAAVHTSFNVANVFLFTPFAGLLAKFVTKLVKDKTAPGEAEATHLTYLDVRMLDTPALSIVQSQSQINLMGDSVVAMLDSLQERLAGNQSDPGLEERLFEKEAMLDTVQKEIFLFLSNLVSGQVPHDVTTRAHMQMRIADEYESLSDYIVSVLKGLKKLDDQKLVLDAPALDKLTRLHARVAEFVAKVNHCVREEDKDVLLWAAPESAAITSLMKEFRRHHLERLQQEEVSPFFSLVFIDILNYYRRMKDHALNIAEVVAGEKIEHLAS